MKNFKLNIIGIAFFALLFVPKLGYGQSAFEILFADKEKYKDVIVDKVLTVNTFMLQGGEEIRMIGLKAPEMPPPLKDERPEAGEMGFIMERPKERTSPVQAVELTALEFVKELLEGQRVRLELDTNKTSDDFKTLAYVYTLENDTFVNTEILRNGYAYLSIQPPNMKHAKLLRAAYRESREQRRGLQGQ